LIRAEQGWPFNNQDEEYKKFAAFRSSMDYKVLPGSHHLHLDPHTAPATAEVISDFLLS